MKVFISWSGDRSKAVAELLAGWIPDVLQGTKCWVSDKDIEKGAVWFSKIQDSLAGVKAGILCVTRENQDAPWLLFEAGGLSKGLATSIVIPLRIDLENSELRPPLAQFNSSGTTKEEMFRLIATLNGERGESKLTDEQLKKAFDLWWPQFEAPLQKLVASAPQQKQAERGTHEMVAELLEISRSIERKLNKPQFNTIPASLQALYGSKSKSELAVSMLALQRRIDAYIKRQSSDAASSSSSSTTEDEEPPDSPSLVNLY